MVPERVLLVNPYRIDPPGAGGATDRPPSDGLRFALVAVGAVTTALLGSGAAAAHAETADTAVPAPDADAGGSTALADALTGSGDAQSVPVPASPGWSFDLPGVGVDLAGGSFEVPGVGVPRVDDLAGGSSLPGLVAEDHLPDPGSSPPPDVFPDAVARGPVEGLVAGDRVVADGLTGTPWTMWEPPPVGSAPEGSPRALPFPDQPPAIDDPAAGMPRVDDLAGGSSLPGLVAEDHLPDPGSAPPPLDVFPDAVTVVPETPSSATAGGEAPTSSNPGSTSSARSPERVSPPASAERVSPPASAERVSPPASADVPPPLDDPSPQVPDDQRLRELLVGSLLQPDLDPSDRLAILADAVNISPEPNDLPAGGHGAFGDGLLPSLRGLDLGVDSVAPADATTAIPGSVLPPAFGLGLSTYPGADNVSTAGTDAEPLLRFRSSPGNVRLTLAPGKDPAHTDVDKWAVFLGPDLSREQGLGVIGELSSATPTNGVPKLSGKLAPQLQIVPGDQYPNLNLQAGAGGSFDPVKGPKVEVFAAGKVNFENYSIGAKGSLPLSGPGGVVIEVEGKPAKGDELADGSGGLAVGALAHLLAASSTATGSVAGKLAFGNGSVCTSCAAGQLDNELISPEDRERIATHLGLAYRSGAALLTDPRRSELAAVLRDTRDEIGAAVDEAGTEIAGLASQVTAYLDEAVAEPARRLAQSVVRDAAAWEALLGAIREHASPAFATAAPTPPRGQAVGGRDGDLPSGPVDTRNAVRVVSVDGDGWTTWSNGVRSSPDRSSLNVTTDDGMLVIPVDGGRPIEQQVLEAGAPVDDADDETAVPPRL